MVGEKAEMVRQVYSSEKYLLKEKRKLLNIL